MMVLLSPMIIVILSKVASLKKNHHVMIQTGVQLIPALLKQEVVNIPQLTVMIITHVLTTLAVLNLDVLIPLLTVMMITRVPKIVVILNPDVST
jgi:hypothetical protein